MPRDVPVCPSKPLRATRTERDHRFTIKLITPMFGGGVEAGSPDPTFPIRPTAIRGQLQFWWRATAGARFEDRETLRAEQTKVWGSTEVSSPTRVLVNVVRSSAAKPCASIDWDQRARKGEGGWRINWHTPFDARDSALPYALFPFQGELPPPNPKAVVKKHPDPFVREAEFELVIKCPDGLWERVEPAIWAWINFGGVGARARRGCGALWCKEFSPRDSDELAAKLRQHTSLDSGVRAWPTLAATVLTRTTVPPGDPLTDWDWTIRLYRYFRQGTDFARNAGAGTKRPGRSRYPEPEAIRRVTGGRSREHRRLKDIPDDAFPRAEFGLPIIFHFKDDKAGDPPDTTLNPSGGRERMASPLILKPLALKDGKAIPLILRLKAEPVDGVELFGVELFEGNRSLLKTEEIRGARLAKYANSPLKGSPNGSALEAFLNLARREGFKEVFS